MFFGELGYTPYEFFNLLPRELNEIVEGFNDKIRRQNEKLIFQAKMKRKAAFISILPHVKPGSITEEKFNREVWPIDEAMNEQKDQVKREEEEKKRIERMREFVRQHNLKLSEQRRLKEQQKST